ncbi:MAG: hypothetical protein OEV66_02065 [Spirochaetia bacterium]|nr:hypothetical protein [Spirochaetia bacterium]
MNKIKVLIVALGVLLVAASCSTIHFNGITEGVEAGTYYISAAAETGTSGNGKKSFVGTILKCTATSELEMTCGSVAVEMAK